MFPAGTGALQMATAMQQKLGLDRTVNFQHQHAAAAQPTKDGPLSSIR
jgi:hypothetical protein